MGFDPIGWLGGAASQISGAASGGLSAIDKALGGTGGSQSVPQTEYSNPSNVVYESPGVNAVINGPVYEGPAGGPLVSDDKIGASAIAPTAEISAPVQTQVIGEYDTVGSSLTKEERNVDPEDTGIIKMTDKPSGKLVQTPEKVVDISKYYKDVKGITSLDYVAAKDLGDSKTQEMIASGKTPEQALVEQYEGARLAGDVRAQNYYENEWRKANVSNIALSGEYHSAARDSGLPTLVNPFENAADISLKNLDRLEGRDPAYNFVQSSNDRSIMSDTGMGGTFKDMLSISPADKGKIMLAGANEVSKAERSGDLGPYANLRSYSSGTPGGEIGEGILSIDRMQDIGKSAAGSSPSTGWDVHPEYMDKFTSEFKSGLGYGVGDYKDSVLPKTGFNWSNNTDLIGGGGKKTTAGLLRMSQEGKAAKKGEKTEEELNTPSEVSFAGYDFAVASGNVKGKIGDNKNVNSLTNIGTGLGVVFGSVGGPVGAGLGGVAGGVVGKGVGKYVPGADNFLSGINDRLLTDKGPVTKYLENANTDNPVENNPLNFGNVGKGAGKGAVIGSILGAPLGPAGIAAGFAGGSIIGGGMDILGITKPNKVDQDVDTSIIIKPGVTVVENSRGAEIINPTAIAPVITEDLSRGSWLDRRIQDAGLPSSSGQNLRGDTLYNILEPLRSPTGMTNAQASNWAMQYRNPKHFPSSLKRKTVAQTQKPKPKRFSLESIHNNLVEKSFDIGLVKFTPTSLEAAVKAVGTSPIKSNVRPNIKYTLGNMNVPDLKGKGLKGVKGNTVGTKGGVQGTQNVSRNIANVMDNITKSSKIKKIKMAK
jgi:hypothetical protein